jgi:hypothetical protein
MGVSENVARLFEEMYRTLGEEKLVHEYSATVELTPTSLIDGLRALL